MTASHLWQGDMAEIDLAKAKAQRTFNVLNEIYERGLHRQNGWTARYDLQLLLEHWYDPVLV